MPRKIALLFATSLMFTVAACDSAEETVEDRAAELPGPAPEGSVEAGRGHHGDHHGKHNPADKLCAALECSDAQAAEIAELFASRHEDRPDEADHEARKAARADAHKAIADAFRAEEFDASVVDRVAPDPAEHGVDREAKLLEFATQLHAILTPEQRAKLADKIEAGGPMLFGGKHGGPGKKGHKQRGPEGKGKQDPTERIAEKVDGFCEPIDCTAEQETQLSATFQAVHEAHREARADRDDQKPDFAPLAAAFRADTLDQAKLRELIAAGKAGMQGRKAEHGKEFGGLLAEIHDILTPEQRGLIADKIEADGLHAVIGGGRGHHGKPGKRGGQGRRGPDFDAK